MSIPFVKEIEFEYGVVQQVTPLIRRVIARNPGHFTFTGTGVYIIGQGRVAVIDPGPILDEHMAALDAALDGETVSHIFATHTHSDHSPAAAPLKARTGAVTVGYGGSGKHRTIGEIQVEAGWDQTFDPDIKARDGDVFEGEGWTLESVHTPGHTSNHLCFALQEENALFTGDHVMGWSTSVIVPPDGGVADYMASLRKLLARDETVFWPTHGPPITDPKPFVQAFIDHRMEREAQIFKSVQDGQKTIEKMVKKIYAGVDPRLHAPASLSVLAHLFQLVDEGRVNCSGEPTLDAEYTI